MELFDSNLAKKVIDHGLSKGADFVDIFVDKTIQNSISFRSNEVQDVKSGIDFGIGVRLIFNDQYLYAYTNSKFEKDLMELVDLMSYQKHDPKMQNFEFKTSSINKEVRSFSGNNISVSQKIELFHKLNEAVRAKNEKIGQVYISLIDKFQEVQIFNSEGLNVFDQRPYCRIATNAVAIDGNNQGTGFDAPGVRGGDEFLLNLDIQSIAEKTSRIAIQNLVSDETPAGNMPVIIDEGFGGVIFHEACGHSLETTSVQKKASTFWDKLDQKIAHECVSATDDGTIDYGWGSLNVDDEGFPTQRTQLIKDGVLKSFMVDKIGELKTGHKRTGSGRRQSYKFAPASRMRNTFIEPGKYKLEDLIASIDNGLYAKNMGGGSVNPGTGEFNFAVEEGYLIKNGKIDKSVKGATLIGKGDEILPKISMVADNFSLSAGMCGSVSGSIPAAVGQPALKVDMIRVGGRG